MSAAAPLGLLRSEENQHESPWRLYTRAALTDRVGSR
jgi:hypothetical protein